MYCYLSTSICFLRRKTLTFGIVYARYRGLRGSLKKIIEMICANLLTSTIFISLHIKFLQHFCSGLSLVSFEFPVQKLRTSVIKKTTNPVWNEDLTLAVRNPATPIKLEVFDKDTFSKDDRMGDAEFDIEALMQIIQMDLEDIRSGTVVRTVRPGRQCCLADESKIIWENGQVVQDVLLKLRNVETGVVHLQLKWVKIRG
ncbi:hypothetical protein GUJ93_ZPchr0013g37507 [Zizania palustris]|uniref:C2 domain-containing protein n=1 Tax=Zizania palustris TaxID=103762 RepID=A0A8J6C0L3_ZIZPA|nr:hypothetical protein GUJ93_ZPchr0013g37507 [Zizania palustris]KAG8100875.1 hypothetical protein GUJ93_ZPchr0013g37507 [Zizania palustris]